MKWIKNRDYTQEGDYDVMTREFLISRGFCCHSGCKNCPYQKDQQNELHQHQSKLVSLVPSWTETLMAAGGNVVGCTRFCIHPKDLVQKCTKLGGTKSLNLDKLQRLQPDFVIMDKEENTKDMAAACPFPILPSHVRSLEDLKEELQHFSQQLQLPELLNYSLRVDNILEKRKNNSTTKSLPGVLEWWRKPEKDLTNYRLVYLIWKNPYMCISPSTYIGSVLNTLGWGGQLWSPQTKGLYPELDLAEIPPQSLLLFSSEPYPFASFKEEFLNTFPSQPAALIDGESYSWFGLRSLRFLEDHL